MNNWQPIAKAPKDGTRVLVYRKRERGYDHLRFGVDKFKDGRWWFSRRDMQPTHFMDLESPEDA